jgi:hypothetical protein
MADRSDRARVPWYLWPFVAVWRLVSGILNLTGRLIGIILGVVLMALGIVISLTVVGAIVGIPLVVLGFMLIVRGLF